ncbi:MAG: response regulator transcription factor [Thermoanaerobaculia bacterium]|nr:response regulator transcription factor [Thermoanaerobaculia bacterium]
MKRIVIADDHPIIIEGLSQLFKRQSEFELVAAVSDGAKALDAVRTLKPDIMVLDVQMPKKDGLSVMREMIREGLTTKVVILTATLDDDGVMEAVELGVWGLVLKESASTQLIDALRRVAMGLRAVDPALVSAAASRSMSRREARRELENLLSPRETDVVRMVAKGLRNKEIAEKLTITEGTVKSYLHSIYEKLGVKGRVELTLLAQDKGLV